MYLREIKSRNIVSLSTTTISKFALIIELYQLRSTHNNCWDLKCYYKNNATS